MHLYSKDQQMLHLERTKAERWFSRINTLLVAVQLACYLVAIIRTSIYSINSMENSFFTVSPLELSPVYRRVGCVYPVRTSHGLFRHVEFQLSAENVEYFVSRSVLKIRYLFVVAGLMIGFGIINKIFYEVGAHEIRFHFAMVRKELFTVWELFMLFMGIALVFDINRENGILRDYIIYCGNTARNQYNFVPPYVELYVMYFITLAIYVCNALVSLANAMRKNPRDEMLAAERQRQLMQEQKEEVKYQQQQAQMEGDELGQLEPLQYPMAPATEVGNSPTNTFLGITPNAGEGSRSIGMPLPYRFDRGNEDARLQDLDLGVSREPKAPNYSARGGSEARRGRLDPPVDHLYSPSAYSVDYVDREQPATGLSTTRSARNELAMWSSSRPLVGLLENDAT